MNWQAQDIGIIANLSALAISLGLIGLTFRSSRNWNLKMVSRFYLSHILVMIGYFLMYSLFSFAPLILSAVIEPLLNWFFHMHSSSASVSDESVSSFTPRWMLLGLLGGWIGAYFSYKNYLKQAQ